jgi:Zn-dependent M16 (insulinase) family peptidase
VTEVFHVNGEGQDAGVVYSEMQARENTAGDLVDLACVCSLLTSMRLIKFE